MKKYFSVDVTDTWRLEVEAKSAIDAERKVLAMTDNGYNDASYNEGATVISVTEVA